MSDFDSVSNSTFVGKYVIVRGVGCGHWAGVVEAIKFVDHLGGEVVLSQARRLCYWQAAKSVTLSAVAKYGIAVGCEFNRIAPAVERVLLQVCEVMPTTDDAREAIMAEPEAEAVPKEYVGAIAKILDDKQQSN